MSLPVVMLGAACVVLAIGAGVALGPSLPAFVFVGLALVLGVGAVVAGVLWRR